MSIQTVRLHQVDYVELVNLAFSCVTYAEKEPLSEIRLCTVVLLKFEVVLRLSYLVCLV